MGKITVLSPNPGGQKRLKRYKNRIHTAVSQAMKGNIDVEHPTATTPKLKISPRNFTPPLQQLYDKNVCRLFWEKERYLFLAAKEQL